MDLSWGRLTSRDGRGLERRETRGVGQGKESRVGRGLKRRESRGVGQGRVSK